MNLPASQQRLNPDPHVDPLIAADVGGTHARVGLIVHDGTTDRSVRVLHYHVYRCAEWESLTALLQNFLDELVTTEHAVSVPIKCCVVACAGYVVGDRVVSENLPWSISLRDVRERLGIDQLDLINDFVAMTWGSQCVDPQNVQAIFGPPVSPLTDPILVVGPGTGLGSGVFVPGVSGGYVLRTEAGHASLAPGNAREVAILQALARDRAYVSVGDALSGPGLLHLYAAICEIEGRPALLTTPAAITCAAADMTSGADAAEAVHVFCGLLGSFVGDLVLMYGARGGVCLTGSILPQILPVLLTSTFAERYFNKGVMRTYLEQIPVYLVEQGRLGVMGAALWYLNKRRNG